MSPAAAGVPLYAPAQVRAADERVIAAGTGSLELMERAAGHLARGILAVAGRAYGLRVALLCGRGNNGGDGLAAARRLAAAGAYPVVHCTAEPARLSPDAGVQWRRWRDRSGRVATSAGEALEGADVAVDCLLGTGARGEPREPERQVIAELGDFGGSVVACDIPSGVDALTGAVPGVAVRADATVTLGAHKVGLWLWPARGHAGRILLGDIGILEAAPAPVAWALTPAAVAAAVPPPDPGAHKRMRGVVTVVAGSPGMSGAAVMTARGAMAAGAGLVTAATLGGAREAVAAAIPEALTAELPVGDHRAALELVAEQAERADALAVGPGLGLDAATIELVRGIVREIALPLVLDADGLNAFRGDAAALADHASPLLVLTPHAAEYARLAGAGARAEDGAETGAGAGAGDLWERRLETVPEHAASWGAVLVAKGPGSLVAAPDGRTWVNPTGSAALATGGTGDVLAGMLAALLAQRPDAGAVAAGVWLHGAAGEEAARRSHARSVTALDVARAVPAALRRCEGCS